MLTGNVGTTYSLTAHPKIWKKKNKNKKKKKQKNINLPIDDLNYLESE